MATRFSWVFLGVFLVASPARAYRTTGDLFGSDGSERIAWRNPHASFVVGGTAPSSVSAVDAEQLLAAMSVWNGIACSAFRFSYGGRMSFGAPLLSDGADGLNTVQWQSEWSFPPEQIAVTISQYERVDGGTWEIVEADVLIQAQHPIWETTDLAAAASNLRSVLTHELGHAVGLLHPCGDDGAPACDKDIFASSAVFPLYMPEPVPPSQDDVDAACFLHPLSSASPASGTGSHVDVGELTPGVESLTRVGDPHASQGCSVAAQVDKPPLKGSLWQLALLGVAGAVTLRRRNLHQRVALLQEAPAARISLTKRGL